MNTQLMNTNTFNEIIAAAKRYRKAKQEDVVRFLIDAAYNRGYQAGCQSILKVTEQ